MDLCMMEHRGYYIDRDMLFDMEIVAEDIHHSLVADNLKRDVYNVRIRHQVCYSCKFEREIRSVRKPCS